MKILLWKKIKSRKEIIGLFKNLWNSGWWVIKVAAAVFIAININHCYEPGRAELTINDVEYEIRWLGVRDTNTSEIINSNKYEIKVLTDVTNKEESKYSARITNTSYIILNQNLQVVDHWNSKQEPILIPPQVTLLKVDAHEIRLDPGNYTLLTQIFYEDYKGCLLYTSPSPRDLSTSRMPSSA